MFFFGYELNQNGEPIVDPNIFRVAFTLKKKIDFDFLS